MKKSISTLSLALIAALALAACNKPTTINPPPEVTPVVVPGPAGPAGPTGPSGTVIVVPPVMPASSAASSTYSLTKPRSTP